jgi:foldase protein PrsA
VKNVKKLIITALLGIFTVSATGCGMIEKTESAVKSTTVAKVGDVKITKGQVDQRMTGVISQAKAQYGENYTKNQEAMAAVKAEAKQTLDSMVIENILLKKATELKLVPEDAKLTEEANKEIADIKKMYFGDDQKQFEEAIKSFGLTNETVVPYFKDQVVMRKVIDDMVKDIKVEDKEVSDYYEANKATMFTEKPGAELFHILVKTEDEAKNIKAKLDKGEKFEDLAKQFGTDGTKDTGGSLGFVEYDTTQMDQDFMAGAKVLKENEVSGPVKTQFGYHIIKAKNIQNQSKVAPLDEVKNDIKEQLLTQKKSERQQKTIEDWKKAIGVKTYEDKL